MPKDSPKAPLVNKPGVSNWLEDAGGTPAYLRRIAEHLRGKGFDTGHAIATAVNTARRIVASKNANPKSRAQAVKALAEWEAKKKKAGGLAEADRDLTPADATVLREWAQALDRDASTLLAALTSRAAPAVKLHAARAAARLVEGHVERPRNDRGYLTAALRSEVAFAAALREAADPMPDALHASATGKCTSPKVLRDGHDGGRECEIVRKAQKGLLDKGFDVGGKGADGVYGPKTARGVRRMQRSYGLKADGVMGRFTNNAMNGGLMEARQTDGDRDLLLLGEALHEVADTGLPMHKRLAARHRADALHTKLSEAGFDHLSKAERSALSKLAVKNARRDREGEFASKGGAGLNVKGRGGKSVGKIAARAKPAHDDQTDAQRAPAYQALDPLRPGQSAQWGALTVKRLPDSDDGRARFDVDGEQLGGSATITRMVRAGRATARPRSNQDQPAAKPVKSRVYEAPNASKKLPWAVTSTDGSRVETARFATKAEADAHATKGPHFAGFTADFAASKGKLAPAKSKKQKQAEDDKAAAVDLGSADSEKPAPKIESYNPKTGPSAAQKAANAATMKGTGKHLTDPSLSAEEKAAITKSNAKRAAARAAQADRDADVAATASGAYYESRPSPKATADAPKKAEGAVDPVVEAWKKGKRPDGKPLPEGIMHASKLPVGAEVKAVDGDGKVSDFAPIYVKQKDGSLRTKNGTAVADPNKYLWTEAPKKPLPLPKQAADAGPDSKGKVTSTSMGSLEKGR